MSRLQGLAHDLAGTASDQNLTFAYNPASQIVTRTMSNTAYASDAVGATGSYAVNGLNQYTSVAGTPFAYDANGNLTSDGATTYVYDAENRLVSASGATSATLSYDPLGRLWQVSSAAGTSRFLYYGDELGQEFDGAGNMLRAYVHGTGPDDPLVWYEIGAVPQRRHLYTDHQGSIVAIADHAGNVMQINAYDAWGVPDATAASTRCSSSTTRDS